MDKFILQWVNNFAGKREWLDILGVMVSEYLIFLLPIIIFLVYFFSKKSAGFLIFKKILLSLVFVYLFNYLIGYLVARSRPFVADKGIYQLAKFFAQASDYSFPSQHTAAAFVLALIVFFDKKKLGIILLILAVLIGGSRVFVGVHYPSDILGGILTACLSIFVIDYLIKSENLNKLKYRKFKAIFRKT
jgi:undecaprenyl-diphosphatase